MEKPTSRLATYVARKVAILQDAGLRPIVVFDGKRPELKRKVSADRRARQDSAKARGNALLRDAAAAKTASERRALEEAAGAAFAGAISVTFEHTLPVIRRLRELGISYIVAPFEADAQLAALAAGGHVTSIVTEDSDVAVFLAACGAGCDVLYRMDDSGTGQLLRVRPGPVSSWISTEHLDVQRSASSGRAAAGAGPAAPRSAVSAAYAPSPGREDAMARSRGPVRRLVSASTMGFLRRLSALSARQFVQLCVLAGCDYLASPPGLGLRTGSKYLQRTQACDDDRRPARLVREMSKDGVKVPAGYRRSFCLAEAGFYWHVVFDPARSVARYLAPTQEATPQGLFASPARAVATGIRRTVSALPTPTAARALPAVTRPSASEPARATAAPASPRPSAASPEGPARTSPRRSARSKPADTKPPRPKAGSLFALVAKMKAKAPAPPARAPTPPPASAPAASRSPSIDSHDSPERADEATRRARELTARGMTVVDDDDIDTDPISAMVGSLPSPADAKAVARADSHPRTLLPVNHPAGTAAYTPVVTGLKAAFAAQVSVGGGCGLFGSPGARTVAMAPSSSGATAATAVARRGRASGTPPRRLRATGAEKRSVARSPGSLFRQQLRPAQRAESPIILDEDVALFQSFAATSQPKVRPAPVGPSARPAEAASSQPAASPVVTALALSAEARAPKRTKDAIARPGKRARSSL